MENLQSDLQPEALLEDIKSLNSAHQQLAEARRTGIDAPTEAKETFIQKLGVIGSGQALLQEKFSEYGFDVEHEDEFMRHAYDVLGQLPEDADWDDAVLLTLAAIEEEPESSNNSEVSDAVQQAGDQFTSALRSQQEYEQLSDKELCIAWQDKDSRALEQLYLRHKPFILQQANRFRGVAARFPGVDVDDLVQEAFFGLAAAARRYKPEASNGAAFLTYAGIPIRHHIYRALDNTLTTIRIPAHVRQQLRTVENINRSRVQNRQRPLTVQEIAETLDIPIDDTFGKTSARALGRWILETSHMGSLDNGYSPRQDYSLGNGYVLDERSPLESLTAEPTTEPVDDAMISTLPELVRTALNSSDLDQRERRILQELYGFFGKDPKTLEEVGVRYDLTSDRVRQITARAMSKLRHIYNTDGLRELV